MKTASKKSVKRKRNTKIVVKRAIIQANSKRRRNTASLSASELEHRIDALEKTYLVATDKEEKKFILKKIAELSDKLEKVYAANEKAFRSNPRKRKGKNPQYKVSAKVPSHIRPITHEVKVPTRTLAVLATRGYVQEMGGGNPNAYTYKSTKLGLGKWRIEAIPKVKSSSGTVKALTAGSAVRKFKKTLAGRGRFKTPRGAYEISVERNPKGKAASRKRRNPKAAGFEAAGKIYRKIEELKRQPITLRRGAAIYKLEKALEKAYASAYAAERAKDSQLYEAPRSFSTAKRKGGSVRKKKANPRGARSYESAMVKVQAALDRLYSKSSPTAADKQKIKKLERYQTSIFNKAWIGEEGEFKEGLKQESLRAQKLDAKREKRIAAKKKANPSRKSASKVRRKNSIGSTVKKVVKSVKKAFRNDGHSNRKKFAGKLSGDKDLFFPPGTPPADELSTLGPLESFTTTGRGKITFQKGQAVLCQDADDNLYVGMTKPSAAFFSNGGPLRNADLGKIKQVEYECAKPHLGEKYKKNTPWFHDFKSPLPHLKTDEEGRPIIKGGGYRIEPEGITG